MSDPRRYALLLGSSRALDREFKLIPQRIRDANLQAMADLLSDLGEASFTWPNTKTPGPKILRDPSRSRITQAFEDFEPPPSSEDLLLLYYFGHGYVGPGGTLVLSFKNAAVLENSQRFTLDSVLQEAFEFGFRRTILIIDCCHSAFARATLAIDPHGLEYYLMASTGRGWSRFDDGGAFFTSALKSALSYGNVKSLIDARRHAVTFEKWFTFAKELMVDQVPTDAGALGAEVLFDVQRKVSSSFDASAPQKSIYTKVFFLLSCLEKDPQDLKSIYKKVKGISHPCFRVTVYQDGQPVQRLISPSTIREYLGILDAIGLAGEEDQTWVLMPVGAEARAGEGARFNEILVQGIFSWLPDELSAARINEILYELATSARLPSVTNFEWRSLQEGMPSIPRRQLRIALRLLSYAGVIQRASSDTFFPRVGVG